MTPEEMIEDLNVRTAIAKEVRVSYNSNEDILFVYLKKEINENNIRIMASDESQDFYTVFGDNDKAIGHILYDFKNKYLNNDNFYIKKSASYLTLSYISLSLLNAL